VKRGRVVAWRVAARDRADAYGTDQLTPMIRSDAIETTLRSHADELRRRFSVKTLSLFGSTVRGESDASSDIDVLVEFDGPATFDGFMDLKFHLESLLGRPVDLATPKALKPRMRPMVEREAVRVA
jgi:predicted nucleotidyltransferase